MGDLFFHIFDMSVKSCFFMVNLGVSSEKLGFLWCSYSSYGFIIGFPGQMSVSTANDVMALSDQNFLFGTPGLHWPCCFFW